VDALVREAGRRVDGGQFDQLLCYEPGLLLQFAARADFPILAFLVRPPCGYFEQVAAGGIPVLLDEQDLWVFGVQIAQHRQHC
jgi:hypothetical protein